MNYNNFTINELVIDVITDFLFLYGANFENIPGKEMTRGIRLFNEIVSEDNLPLLSPFGQGFTVPGENSYVGVDFGVALLRDVQSLKIRREKIWYPLKRLTQAELDRNEFQDEFIGVQGRPAYYWFLTKKYGSDEPAGINNVIVLYPTPDAEYEIELVGRENVFEIGNQNLVLDSLNAPPEWIAYLRYALARKIKDYHTQAKWTPAMENEYKRLYSMISYRYNDDTATKTDSALLNDNQYGRRYWGCYPW